jgi:hypothetical protein
VVGFATHATNNMTLEIDGVLDIETQDWDKFVLGEVLYADGTSKTEDWRGESDLVDALLQRGGHLWTWNGGLFDSLWLLGHLRKRGLRCRAALAGTRIVSLDTDGLCVHDGAALVPMSLAKASLIAGIALEKDTGLECRCGSACGGYCAIRRDMPPSEYLRLGRYLRRDTEATLAILKAIVTEAERSDMLLGQTVGSTSYKTAASICGIEKAEWEAPLYRFARSAYYGGRVEVFRPQSPTGHAYDINSAYPAALTRVELPTGVSMLVRGDRAQRAYKRQRPGCYMARVQVPSKVFAPPLPVRTPGGRVVFPTGAFRGVWTLLELRRAEESGATVHIDRALVWSDSELVLAPFMLHGWSCRTRAAAEGNASLAAWWKWVLNSCTGKFAEDPSKERVVINPEPEDIKTCACESKRRCYCNAWRPLDDEGEVWSAPFWRIPTNGHVHWAAYLTAATRIQLLDQIEADGLGGRTALYCDTDSVYASSPRSHDVGPELGQWKSEGEITGWRSLAPKVYRFERGGETIVRGKGLPGLDADGFERFARGEAIVVERGVMGLRSAVRKGGEVFRRKHLSRQNRADGRYFGGRELKSNGLTYPRTFQEILRWERGK